MKRLNAFVSAAIFLSLSLIGLSGCSTGSFVNLQPAITSFTANPTTVTAGGSASLTGVFSNGTGVITPGNLSATSGTPVSVSPSTTTTYTLTVTSSAGATMSQTATVTVNAAKLGALGIDSFTANPTTIASGGSSSLTGVFSNGTGVTTPGTLTATSGTPVSVSPAATTTYTLTVTSSTGATESQTATVTVNAVAPSAPAIASFTANPTTITSGGSSSLTGVFSNGTGVVTPGNLAVTSGTAVSVSPAATTTYTLTVTNSANASVSQTATVTVTALAVPGQPTGLTAIGGNASVSLSWTASAGASTYNVYRSTTPGGEGTTAFITGVTTTSYTDNAVTNGTPYYYEVAAVNASGASALSAEATATPELALPAPPSGLTATAGDSEVLLTWGASNGATSYHVKRSTASGGPFTQVAAPTGTSYTDTGLSNGTTYYYVVTAVNTAGESGNSNTVSATPAASGFGVTIPNLHPRLWFNAARLAQAKAWLAANPKAPAPSDTTSADYFIDVAWRHVVAGGDCTSAINFVLAQPIPSDEYAPSSNGSDRARWNGEAAFLVYDWCFDVLTTQQRSNILSNIAGTGAGWNNYLTGINQQRWGGPAMMQDNYNIGNMRNDIESGIGTYWENISAATGFLTDGINVRWSQYFVPSVTTSAAGGVGQEGPEYASELVQDPIIPFVTMSLNGRDIFNETEYFKEQAYWIIYGTTPAPTPNMTTGTAAAYQLNPFNDDEEFVSGGYIANRNYYQNFMNFASNYWSTLNVGKYARQWVNTVGASSTTPAASNYILGQDSQPAAMEYTSLPLDYYATGIRYLYGRTAWDTSSTYFMWQLGIPTAGVGHSHTDIGNFNLWRGGRWLSRETTGYVNTITGYGYQNEATDSTDGILAHNGILFGTYLSPSVGDLTLGLMPESPSQTTVRRLDSQPGYVYADVDMTAQYLWPSGETQYNTGAVGHVERELLFLRDLETTLVFDRVTTGNVTVGSDKGLSAANEVNTFVIHFETNPTLEDATHLTATNGSQALRVTTLVPSAPVARRVINEQSCGGCSAGVGQYRVELDTTGAAQRYFLNVLQGRDATGSNLVATVVDSVPTDPTTGTFTVTLQPSAGAATTVVFNKGQTSSGGTVNLAGAGAVALRTGVQSISYTDNGPAWGN